MAKLLVSIKPYKHPRYPWRVSFRQGEKYERKYFLTKADAKTFADEKRVELLNKGREHGDITELERRAVIRSRALAEQFLKSGVSDFSIDKALDHYAAHIEACGKSVVFTIAFEEYHALKTRAGKSQRYLRDIESRLTAFALKHGKRLVSEVSRKDVESYLHSLQIGSLAMLSHHRLLHGFFAWCVACGYTASNPAAKFEKPKILGKPPGILSPAMTRALLSAAPPEIVPALAVGFFAGLRTAEIERLDWAQIDLNRGFIEVTAENAKTAQRRLVTISHNLKAWLVPLAHSAGLVRPTSQVFRDRFEVAKRTAKLQTWPSNACRHSFASYHLALNQDAAVTALQLGHMSTVILFKHYRELARPEDGAAYFNILPIGRGTETPNHKNQ